jgi:hypothetical protein
MATMKIVATTQLVVQTMGVCWVLGVGCWVYIFYVENIIKKFIIFLHRVIVMSMSMGIKAIRHANRNYFHEMMNVISG